jgi:outer membrane protein OmpA-like peptidoglycan-associated protein
MEVLEVKKQANLLLVIFFFMELLYNIGCVMSQDMNTYDTDQQLLQLKGLYDKGDYEKTYNEAKKITETDKQNSEVWLYMGLSACKINLYKESLESLQKALDIDQNLSNACKGIAEVYLKNGVWSKAFVYYKKVTDLNPKDDLCRNLCDLCEKAYKEQKDKGFVSAETLIQVERAESQPNQDFSKGKYRSISVSDMRIPLSIGFYRGKYRISDLSNSGLEQLKAVSNVLKENDWLGKTIVVESHACSCGSRQNNFMLSKRRAETILDYLISQGVIKTENAYVVPCGEDKPLENSPYEDLPSIQCENDEMHSMNRRVIIREYIPDEKMSQNINNSSKPEQEAKTPSLDVSFFYRHKTNGELKNLTDEIVLHSQDEIKVFLMSPKQIYAYIFYHKSNGDLLCLYPSETQINPVEPNRKYWFPSSVGRFRLKDDTTGTEEIFVYLSEKIDLQKEELAKKNTLSNEPKSSRIEKETTMNTRGVGGIINIDESKESSLPKNWYKHVKFQYEP